MTDPHEIGARIRTVRRERGWTQDELAQAVRVSRSAVAQWETGRAGQLIPNLARIADVLGVGLEFLTHGDAKHAAMEATTGDELAMLRLIANARRGSGRSCCAPRAAWRVPRSGTFRPGRLRRTPSLWRRSLRFPGGAFHCYDASASNSSSSSRCRRVRFCGVSTAT